MKPLTIRPSTRLGNAAAGAARFSVAASAFLATFFLTPRFVHPVASAAAARNPIGYCTSDLEKAKKAGFEFAELAVKGFAAMPDDEFARFLAKHKEVGIPTPVGNNFLPGELKVVGPDVDEAKVMDYVKKAFDRAKQLGLKTIVFGSGGARKVPDGFAKEEAMKQLVAIAKKMAPEAKKRGITLAVEPLQSKETNIINTAGEGLEWVKAVGHPNFQLMVDFYHLALEKEDPSILVTGAKAIKHIHIANPKGRVFPQSADEYDYSGFFANLRKSGYKGGISVEGKANDYDAEAPKAIAFLREAADKGVKAPATPAAAPVPAPAAPAAAAPAK
jgi:D-psicose/D-tagatose/L-ribulose 3-epimerase